MATDLTDNSHWGDSTIGVAQPSTVVDGADNGPIPW